MKSENVRKLDIALNLRKKIIGVKFIDFKEDFDAIDVELSERKGSICFHAREAMDGELFKIVKENVICDYGKFALGLKKPDSTIVEGRSFEYCGLSETNSIGKNIVASMKYIDHTIYGLIMGPLASLEDADIVIITDYAETIMRVMQGYAYKYGNPEKLSFFGNQAMCADLISKPHSNNDINISLMCKGARTYGRFDRGEIGVSIPIAMFDNLVDGIIKTVNPVSSTKEKLRMLGEMNKEDELGIAIDLNYNYGIGLKEYDNRVLEIRKKEQA